MSLDAAFAAFPELETPRLRLREPRPEDAAALFAVFSDEEVVRYYGVLPHQSVADSAELIRRLGEWYAAQQAIRWAITRNGEDVFLGSCGFHRFDRESRRAELGYEVGRAHWRQGIASEAVGALLVFGFDRMGLHRIEATVDGDNEPSKRLLLKLGFTTRAACASASGSTAATGTSTTSACCARTTTACAQPALPVIRPAHPKHGFAGSQVRRFTRSCAAPQ